MSTTITLPALHNHLAALESEYAARGSQWRPQEDILGAYLLRARKSDAMKRHARWTRLRAAGWRVDVSESFAIFLVGF